MQWMSTIVRAEIDRHWDKVIPQNKNTLKFGEFRMT